ncbi:stage III sporulation protein AH [Orenia metallireducens]|uniref:Stage III sporulation protein AH n=1 Tax=Orenia metallireducens TaxID=1413210 RepID=A0A285HLA9_9FIRM|nr:SpoIIIAH-like family protein [Orenia metallireducens]PRX26906.1 stage III sporulation protein AH [Orenia metallireducens]SNY36529.1 stage III sporulation protein AH [Orenia metallireducens]
MKIVGMITDQELKRRAGWFLVLMLWVGMVTAVVIHRSSVSDNHLADISSQEGYVAIEDVKESDTEIISEEPILNDVTAKEVINLSKGDKDTKNKGKDFFVEYRIDRDQARSEQINLLREMINNPNSDKNLKSKAQERLLTLTNNIEKEMEIESLVRARGYQDGIAFIHDKSIELIICTEALKKEDVAKLGDIIKNSTNINLQNITIIEKKPE